MNLGQEHNERLNLRLGVQETYDLITSTIDKKTKFAVKEADPPNKIVAYGGRGPSKLVKAASGVISFGVLTAATHYGSPKRTVNISIKDVKGITAVTIRAHGVLSIDSRLSTFVGTIREALGPHAIDELEMEQKGQSEDPLAILKARFAKGEISKEEFEDMKKALE